MATVPFQWIAPLTPSLKAPCTGPLSLFSPHTSVLYLGCAVPPHSSVLSKSGIQKLASKKPHGGWQVGVSARGDVVEEIDR